MPLTFTYLKPCIFWRMTTAERDAENWPDYATICNTDVHRIQRFVQEEWVDVAEFIGTPSDEDYLVWNDTEKVFEPKSPAEVMAILSGEAAADFAMNSNKITGLTAGSASNEAVEFDQLHAQSHNVASHSDTTATGAETETLTDGSDADSLHDHTNHGVTHNAVHGISKHTEHANWKVFHADGSGDEQEVAVGADGTVFTGTAVDGAPEFGAADDHAHSSQASLTSIQSLTVTLADAGADALFGWDDTASAYENLSKAEALAVLNVTDGADVTGDNAPKAHGPSSHTEGTGWRLAYQDAAGDEQEIALGDDGEVLTSTGAASAPAFEAAAGGATTPYVIWGELVDNAVGVDRFRMISAEWQDQATKTFDKLVVCTLVNTTGAAVFDFNKNGASVGTVTIANGTRRGEAIVTNFTLTASDILSVDKDSGNDEGVVTQAWVIEAENTS